MVFILWLLVTLPMGLIRFIIMPVMAIKTDHSGILYWTLMIAGMIWQFILSLIILKLELGTLNWSRIKERLWLNPPKAKDGTYKRRLYLMTIPIILYGFFFEQTGIFSFIEEGINVRFPALALPAYAQITNLMDPRYQGCWSLLILALISCLFNYLLGEELFFRGILLPKMEEAFGKFDWVVNAFLFSAYHVHKISEVPLFFVGSIFIAFLNKKYKSFWPSVIIHGLEAIPLVAGVIFVIWFI